MDVEAISGQEQAKKMVLENPAVLAEHVMQMVTTGTSAGDGEADVPEHLDTPPHPNSDRNEDDETPTPKKKGQKRKGDGTFFELGYAMQGRIERKKASGDGKIKDIRDSIQASQSSPKASHNRRKVPALVVRGSTDGDASRRKKSASKAVAVPRKSASKSVAHSDGSDEDSPRPKKTSKRPAQPKTTTTLRKGSSKSVAHSDGSGEESSDESSYDPADEARDSHSIGEEEEDEDEEEEGGEEAEEDEEEDKTPARARHFVEDEAARPLKQRRLFPRDLDEADDDEEEEEDEDEGEEEEDERPAPKRAPVSKKTKNSKAKEKKPKSSKREHVDEEDEEEEDSVDETSRAKTVSWQQGSKPPTNPRLINAAASSVMHSANPKATKDRKKASKGKASSQVDVVLCDVGQHVVLPKKVNPGQIFHFDRWASGSLSAGEVLFSQSIAEHLPNVSKRVRADVVKFTDDLLQRDPGGWKPLSKQNRGRISKLHQHLIHFCVCFGIKEKYALSGLYASIEATMEQFGQNELKDTGLLCSVYTKYTNTFVKVAISRLAAKLRVKGTKLVKNIIQSMDEFVAALQ